jgi:hypothetical protein
MAMDIYKLKIRIGEHEFEAEGPQDAVERQFQAFKELIASPPPLATKRPDVEYPSPNGHRDLKPFNSIFRNDGRVISLTAPPHDIGEGALLILFGQKEIQGEETPTGSQIADGLRRSGYVIPGRVDRILDDFVSQGLVIKMGVKKGTRYRLTNTGSPKAADIAERTKQMVA